MVPYHNCFLGQVYIQLLKVIHLYLYHLMANRRGEVETLTDFIFLGSKITVDCDCNHEIKRHLFFGGKAMTDLPLLLLSHFSRVGLCATP